MIKPDPRLKGVAQEQGEASRIRSQEFMTLVLSSLRQLKPRTIEAEILLDGK